MSNKAIIDKNKITLKDLFGIDKDNKAIIKIIRELYT
jgi:hypothetical protein